VGQKKIQKNTAYFENKYQTVLSSAQNKTACKNVVICLYLQDCIWAGTLFLSRTPSLRVLY